MDLDYYSDYEDFRIPQHHPEQLAGILGLWLTLLTVTGLLALGLASLLA